jgi:arsenite methyltransferase
MPDRYGYPFTAPEHRQVSIAKYRDKAAGYDASARRTWPIRVRTIALLQLQANQRVIDVGCGTGLSFKLLREAVGAHGEVAGIEHSPDMAARARARIASAGWANVRVIEAAVEHAQLTIQNAQSNAQSIADGEVVPAAAKFDAALFNYTHDILRSPDAVANLMRQLKPGARIAVAGMKYPPKWAWPLRWIAKYQNRSYNGNYAALEAPWDTLLPYICEFSLCSTLFGTGYIAHCRIPATRS